MLARMKIRSTLLAAALVLTTPSAASAFCGFYVSGAETKLYNNATLVVLMRGGTKTVLSMQNNYQGPPADFALVVPVPVVLQKENVKTLPRAIFDKIDQLGSPRLVEYWEQNPCAQDIGDAFGAGGLGLSGVGQGGGGTGMGMGLGRVKVEARFDVGEYEIVILSAEDASGLDAWLRANNYKIPAGAEPYLRPYVQQGSKFFVAKVNVAKVKFENGQAMLSPLRFHYDSDRFTLPVKLGLINSQGSQDLVVNILAKGQRYEVANYPNVTIPTNLDVADGAREKFGAFYNALFDRTVEKHPRAVVTEYAWDTGSCDPCPGPALDGSDLATLGADVVTQSDGGGGGGRGLGRFGGGGMVLTRLHARYGKDVIGDDLVFRAVEPIEGGREFGAAGKTQPGAHPAQQSNFQARYAIRHKWEGAITCEKPVRGTWGPPPGAAGGLRAAQAPPVKPATRIAFQPRGGVQLASLLLTNVSDLGVVLEEQRGAIVPPTPTMPPPPAYTTTPSAAPDPVAPTPPPPSSLACIGCAMGGTSGASWGLGALVGVAAAFARRRRRR
jgi:MYXO-CTERM domain-containing protein